MLKEARSQFLAPEMGPVTQPSRSEHGRRPTAVTGGCITRQCGDVIKCLGKKRIPLDVGLQDYTLELLQPPRNREEPRGETPSESGGKTRRGTRSR